jgi:hypothetical protein
MFFSLDDVVPTLVTPLLVLYTLSMSGHLFSTFANVIKML